jgi:hypothetical protein
MGSMGTVLGAFLFTGRVTEPKPQLHAQGQTRTPSHAPSGYNPNARPFKAWHHACRHKQCSLTRIQRDPTAYDAQDDSFRRAVCVL